MSETKNIYQRILAITAELKTVAKNLSVGTGSNQYKAVSERDVLDAVKPIEEKHGVVSYACYREVIESNLLESESEYNGKVSRKTTLMSRIKTIYRFVNIDNPEDYIETVVFSEGIDAQDKGSGKAMTYADKYALMKVYKISTGDDPDQTASEDVEYKKTSGTKKEYKCHDCGRVITDYTAPNGRVYTAEEMYNGRIKKYGRALCGYCAKKPENNVEG